MSLLKIFIVRGSAHVGIVLVFGLWSSVFDVATTLSRLVAPLLVDQLIKDQSPKTNS